MLPYFKRGEDNERGEDGYHGVGGPQTVSDSRSMHPLVDACSKRRSRPATPPIPT